MKVDGIKLTSATDIAKELIEMRQLHGGRMGINDDKTNTNLIIIQ